MGLTHHSCTQSTRVTYKIFLTKPSRQAQRPVLTIVTHFQFLEQINPSRRR